MDPMIARLASGDEAYCRARLKMVPHVVKGSWSIKKMVGSKPAIIGKVLRACHVEKRIQQRRNDSGSGGGSRFLEVQLDASSNRAARYLINAASNKGVVMDMGLVLQAETEAELPEQILGGLRVHRLSDISAAGFESFNDAAVSSVSASMDDGDGRSNNSAERSGLGSTSDGSNCYSDELIDGDAVAVSSTGATASIVEAEASEDFEQGCEEGDPSEPHHCAIDHDLRQIARHCSSCEGGSEPLGVKYPRAHFAASPHRKSTWQKRLERESSEDMESI